MKNQKGPRSYDGLAGSVAASGIESARMMSDSATRQAPRPAGSVKLEGIMKSLFNFLSLVLLVGSLFADVPVERKLPQLPPNQSMSQDVVLRDRPINDQPSAPPRIIVPLILPGVDDPGAPPKVDDPNSPPKANRPRRSPSLFYRMGPIGELHMVGGTLPSEPPPYLGPVIRPYVDRPTPVPVRSAYPLSRDASGGNRDADVLGPDQPVVTPRSIMPVEDPRLVKPKSGQQIVDPIEKPVKSPDRIPIAIGEDVPGPRHSPQSPPNNLYPDNVGPDYPPQYVGVQEGGPGAGLDMTRPGPSVRIPEPFFRNLIRVHFGPGASRVPVTGKLFDMNGRLVFSQQIQGGQSVSFSGARLASLPSGSYILQIDCRDPSKYLVRVQKVE